MAREPVQDLRPTPRQRQGAPEQGVARRRSGLLRTVLGERDDADHLFVAEQNRALRERCRRCVHAASQYFDAADMASHASDTMAPTAAFQVLTAADNSASPATQPLMAVFSPPPRSGAHRARRRQRALPARAQSTAVAAVRGAWVGRGDAADHARGRGARHRLSVSGIPLRAAPRRPLRTRRSYTLRQDLQALSATRREPSSMASSTGHRHSPGPHSALLHPGVAAAH